MSNCGMTNEEKTEATKNIKENEMIIDGTNIDRLPFSAQAIIKDLVGENKRLKKKIDQLSNLYKGDKDDKV